MLYIEFHTSGEKLCPERNVSLSAWFGSGSEEPFCWSLRELRTPDNHTCWPLAHRLSRLLLT